MVVADFRGSGWYCQNGMSALCEYALTEWRPRLKVRAAQEKDASLEVPLLLPVLMKALAPFREAREAVAEALREAAGHEAGSCVPPGPVCP